MGMKFQINETTEYLWKNEHLTYNCVQPDLCDDNRNKPNINPRAGLDILNGLISSAQDAKCPDESYVCCSKNFTQDLAGITTTTTVSTTATTVSTTATTTTTTTGAPEMRRRTPCSKRRRRSSS